MKPKLILLAIGMLGFVAANATAGPDDPGTGKGKKDDINGLVMNADTRKPMKDVTVTAYSANKKEKTVVTDEAGNFSFDELKPGTYKFIFEKSGFRKVSRDKVVVKTDEAFQLNIEMIESSTSGYDQMPSPFHFSDF